MTKTRSAALLVAGLLALLSAQVAVGWQAPTRAAAPTVVSITFDDTYADTIPALDLMKARGIPGTLFVNSQRVGYSAAFMSRTQLKTYADSGFEIGGHTLSHEDLTTLSIDDARANICADRTNLINLGYRVTSFAYPFGAENPAIQQAVRDCGYNSGRIISDLKSPATCLKCDTAETVPPVNPYEIRTPASIRPGFTLDQIEAMVTQAENDRGGWVPLVFHHISDDPTDSNSIPLATFTAFLDWLQARPSSTVIKTVDQVIGGAVQPPPNGDDPVPNPDTVYIGSRSHVIDGVNAYRAANTLVLYTRVKGATTATNAYGTEVSIVNGTVTAVQSGVGNMAIPAGGVVLSGHGDAATWLRSYAPVGASVYIPNLGDPLPPPPPPPPTYPTTQVTVAGQVRAVDGTNATRRTNNLIVYTPDFGASTGTNEFGYEAAVVNGVVTQVASGVGNMAIPANGYVLSGHGTARTFLASLAKVGASVS